MLKVLFFAQLKEQLNCAELSISLTDSKFNKVNTLEQLRNTLAQKDDNWRTSLQSGRVLMAVNQTLVDGSVLIKDGDEVAFFPPVTGG